MTRDRRWSLSALAIRRHIGTLMLTLAVVIIGLFSLANLQVDLLPSITYPRIGLRLDVPGLAPEVAIDEVTRPLEEILSATEGVEQVYSQTREGRISVDLFFKPGGNVDQALNEATAAFNRGRGQLPDAIESPRLFKFDPSQLPVYELALTSPSLQPVELRILAEQEIGRELSSLDGVAGVDVVGGVEEEVQVAIDLERLQAMGVGLRDVLDALEERNQDIAGGQIRGGRTEPLTRTVGRFQTIDEIRNLSIQVRRANDNPAPSPEAATPAVYLRDFATVIDGTAEQRVSAFLNNQVAVKVSVQKQPDANTIQVVQAVQARLDTLKTTGVLPQDVVLVTTLDESLFIQQAIANVTRAGVIGAGLAAVAVLLFLGSLRQTLIIVLAIPLATLGALTLMGLFGLSLNVFSLGGLALGVGIVVDNAIVMLETIAQGVGLDLGAGGQHPSRRFLMDQAIASSQSVESALVASTSTNLVAVLPFLLIGGFFALLFNQLILTISFAIAASIAIAITLVPMLASRLLAIRWSSRVSQFWGLRWFNQQFTAATQGYGRGLQILLKHRLIVVGVAVLLLGSSSLWMVNQIPQEILPQISNGQARLFAQFPAGTPLSDNQKVMAAVDDILINQPETEYAFTTVGGFLFGSATIANPLNSSSTITLAPGTPVDAYTERVNRDFQSLNLAGVRLRLVPGRVRGLILSNSPLFGADIDLAIQGREPEALEAASQQILAALDEQVTLARFRTEDDARQPEVQIRPDWERVASLDLNTTDIGNTIQTAVQGSVPTQLQRGERLVDVRVQLDRSQVQQPSQLIQLPLFTDGREPIRLGDVAQIVTGRAPQEIKRINQRQVFLLAGNLAEDATLSEAVAQVNQVIDRLELPPGVSLLPSAAAASNQQIQDAFKVLGGLAIFFVFVVMAVQYNSLIDPLVILLTIPLALTGGIFGLYVTGTAIGATVIIGAILLVGIVVNNAIIMVELANQIYAEQGCCRDVAIAQAAPRRLRPILMTTITTVLGMFPLALGVGEGSEFLQPLGVVVFSGLSLATVLTLVIIPCFYVLLHEGWRSNKPDMQGQEDSALTWVIPTENPPQPAREQPKI